MKRITINIKTLLLLSETSFYHLLYMWHHKLAIMQNVKLYEKIIKQFNIFSLKYITTIINIFPLIYIMYNII